VLYAHVTNGTVDQTGQPPEKWFDGTRWWDLRGLNAADLARAGWYPVTEATRPADTATDKYQPSYAVNGDVVIQSWVSTPKTQDELNAELASTNYAELLAKVPAAISNNITALTNLQNAVNALNTIAGQSFNNQTQRDTALKNNATHTATIGSALLPVLRQNNSLMRIMAGLLDTTAGT
jgi:hypothetical protein